jgi:tripartite motif-containing protein 71
MPETTMPGRAARLGLAVGLAVLMVSCGNPSTFGKGTTAKVSAHPLEVKGRFTARSLGLTRPDALAIAPNGDLYVTDVSQRVTVISPQGHVLRRWGRAGSDPGQFRFTSMDPADPGDVKGRLAVAPDGTVYVADSGNGRVQVFTQQGRFLRQFGGFGTAPGQFLAPVDLVVDRSGNAYVVDDQKQTMAKFDSTGKVLWQIGGSTSEADLVGHLHLSMIDSHHRVVLTNDGNGRILYIDEKGHKVDVFGGKGVLVQDGPCDVTVDALGYTYVAPCTPGATYVFDRAHHLVGRWAASTESLYTAPRFGPGGDNYALERDGSVVRLRPTLGGS